MHIGGRSVNVVGAWVLAASDAMRAAAEQATGMAGAGPGALVAIAAEPAMSIDVLRGALGLTHPGTVRLVDRLVERGWVERAPAGGRSVALRATEAGLDARDALLRAREEALVALLEPLGAERERLAELLEPIVIAQAPDTTALRRLCRLCDREACEPCPPWQHLDHPDHLDDPEYGDSPNSAAGRTAGGPAGGLAGSGG